jgi:malonyl-CoA O-methyltransferase
MKLDNISSGSIGMSHKVIRDHFERAAPNYDQFALLQREVAERMFASFAYTNISPEKILDIGAGTGYCTRWLQDAFKESMVVGLDLSHNMLCEAKKKEQELTQQPSHNIGLVDKVSKLFSKSISENTSLLCADTEQLPLANDSMDLIFSNFTLQWCSDLPNIFKDFMRVMRPGSLLTFSTLGTDTLKELRQSWQEVDSNPHVNDFLDMHDIGDMLLNAGFSEPVTSVDRFEISYPSVMDLMRDLKGLGATNAAPNRLRGLMGKSSIYKLEQAYRGIAERDGKIVATWEVVYGHAWAPQAAELRPNLMGIPIGYTTTTRDPSHR